MRLDKYLTQYLTGSKLQVLRDVSSGKVCVNDRVIKEKSYQVGRYDTVKCASVVIKPLQYNYWMLNKPIGYVSATKDKKNKTVIDLMPKSCERLHLAGRLDKFTTGLIILTDDGVWSKKITRPESKIPKVYRVEAEREICLTMVEEFKKGVFFEKENVMTQPAQVEVLSSYEMELTIYEGMHHQIKRMLLKFNNRVKQLHRYQIGCLTLDVAASCYRPLSPEEQKQLVK